MDFLVRVVTMKGAKIASVQQTSWITATGLLEARKKADELVAGAPSWLGGNVVDIMDGTKVIAFRSLLGDW